ncbi:MAG TPA: type IV pili twitching motility protein PilT, partial [Fibrobacteraceae bacterium]|nr:type IV pili twitching motility protein PilT [Fibrobacteraceae bacterium]
ILVNTAAIHEYILDRDKQNLIVQAIAEGNKQYGSQTFDQSIFRLYNDGLIEYDTAYKAATNPDDLDLKIRGIEGTSDRSWM